MMGIPLVKHEIDTTKGNISYTNRIHYRKSAATHDTTAVLRSSSNNSRTGFLRIDKTADSVYRSNCRIITAPCYASVCCIDRTYCRIEIGGFACSHSFCIGRNTNRRHKDIFRYRDYTRSTFTASVCCNRSNFCRTFSNCGNNTITYRSNVIIRTCPI